MLKLPVNLWRKERILKFWNRWCPCTTQSSKVPVTVQC
jgi:hypothetical protein